MIPPLSKLRRLDPRTVVGVAAGELARLVERDEPADEFDARAHRLADRLTAGGRW